MSVQQIMKSEAVICTVPDERKARAVKQCFEGEISPMHPASILRNHPRAFVFLDEDAASQLSQLK
jgi:glucosamine-6-phosphate deaminase